MRQESADDQVSASPIELDHLYAILRSPEGIDSPIHPVGWIVDRFGESRGRAWKRNRIGRVDVVGFVPARTATT
jgi:hypothetical protein